MKDLKRKNKAPKNKFFFVDTENYSDLPNPGTESLVLDDAKRLVHGDRGKNYGHPIKDFTCIAGQITAIFRRKGYLKDDVDFAPQDIPLIMQAVKISRECNQHKKDNCVDGAGYWETLAMVEDRLSEKKGQSNEF